jgi:hypothetical protein
MWNRISKAHHEYTVHCTNPQRKFFQLFSFAPGNLTDHFIRGFAVNKSKSHCIDGDMTERKGDWVNFAAAGTNSDESPKL